MTNTLYLRSLGRGVLMAALAITPALAVNVTYNTTGTFTGGSNTITGANSLSITYGNLSGANVNTPGGAPTNAQFGAFTASGGSATAGDAVASDFTLVVTQTAPTAGSQTLTDVFAGTIFTNSSTIVLQFTGGTPGPTLTLDPLSFAPAYSFQIGTVTYWVDQSTPINPSTTGGGVSTINGAIEANAAPEPAFYGLTGTGFAALVVMAIRRRRQTVS